MKILYTGTDRNTVSSSDPLRKNKNTFLLNTLSNTPHTPKKGAPLNNTTFHYPLSYGVPVRERYGSTLLPATREQHDQNCTQSH